MIPGRLDGRDAGMIAGPDGDSCFWMKFEITAVVLGGDCSVYGSVQSYG